MNEKKSFQKATSYATFVLKSNCKKKLAEERILSVTFLTEVLPEF